MKSELITPKLYHIVMTLKENHSGVYIGGTPSKLNEDGTAWLGSYQTEEDRGWKLIELNISWIS